MSLEGKIAVVVGGSSGIGLATAKVLAAEGARVVIGGRSEERLRAARESIAGRVETRALDMTDASSVGAFVEAVGPLDHLVISAAGAAMGRFLDLDVDSARRFFDSKFWGPYVVARGAAPRMRGAGSITFFSGAAGSRATPGFSCGSAINAAVETLVRTLAVELAPIRVNTISPGIIDTPVWESLVPAGERDALFAETAAKLPAGRIGRPDEVAGAVLFLLRNEYTTGTTLFVDGGYLQM